MRAISSQRGTIAPTDPARAGNRPRRANHRRAEPRPHLGADRPADRRAAERSTGAIRVRKGSCEKQRAFRNCSTSRVQREHAPRLVHCRDKFDVRHATDVTHVGGNVTSKCYIIDNPGRRPSIQVLALCRSRCRSLVTRTHASAPRIVQRSSAGFGALPLAWSMLRPRLRGPDARGLAAWLYF